MELEFLPDSQFAATVGSLVSSPEAEETRAPTSAVTAAKGRAVEVPTANPRHVSLDLLPSYT